MKSITNTQAPAIIEDIVRAHHLPGRFRADTANNSLSTILCTIDEVDAEARKVLFTVRKRGLRTGSPDSKAVTRNISSSAPPEPPG